MTLTEFKKMWQEDGTRLVKESQKKLNGATWLLFSVYFPYFAVDYGRHMAMILKINSKTKQILQHDVVNILGEIGFLGRQGIDEWFAHQISQAE